MVELYRKQKELDFTYENCKKQLFGTEKLSFRTNYFFISKIVYNEECVSKISAHLWGYPDRKVSEEWSDTDSEAVRSGKFKDGDEKKCFVVIVGKN